MIISLTKTEGRISKMPILEINIRMSDGTKLVEVYTESDNSASVEFDRYLNALREAEQAIYAVFYPDKVFTLNVANSRRQPGEAESPIVPLPRPDCRKDDPLCRLGDEGPIPCAEVAQ